MSKTISQRVRIVKAKKQKPSIKHDSTSLQEVKEFLKVAHEKAREFAERQLQLYPNMSPFVQNHLEVFGCAIEISKLWEPVPSKIKSGAPAKIIRYFQKIKAVIEMWEKAETALIKEARAKHHE